MSFKASWLNSIFRVKDPSKSIKFYEEKFGMSLIHQKTFDKHNTSFYFLATLPQGVPAPGNLSVKNKGYIFLILQNEQQRERVRSSS